jgi:hypothetical protein
MRRPVLPPSGNEGDSFLKWFQLLVRLTQYTLGEYNQRALAFQENVDALLDSLPIDSFTIHTEGSQSPQNPGIKSAPTKEMCTGHRVKWLSQSVRQTLQDACILRPAVIRSQQNSVSGLTQISNRVFATDFDLRDTVFSFEINRCQPRKKSRPKAAFMRRHELVF